MHKFKELPWIRIAISASLLTYLLSLTVARIDTTFAYRWVTFSMYILAIVSIVIMYLWQTLPKQWCKKISEEDIFVSGALLLIITSVSFLAITNYPFVSVGDEVRDGGLNALQIAHGTLKNIFGYGRYDAHGLIIPTVTSFFYHIFGNSVLTFRFPSAILACLDVLLFFILMRQLVSRTAAFFSSFVLAAMPLHLFFARTQVVVAFSSFWSSVLLLSLFFFLKRERTIDYIFFGTLLGFIFGFHAAIRVIAILLLLAIIATNIFKLIKKTQTIQSFMTRIMVLLLFCFVGFGPRLLFTNSTSFFHTSRLTVNQDVMAHTNETATLKDKYIKSLMVWVYEPTNFEFPDHHPLFPPVLVIFFLLGVGYSFFILKKPFLYILMYLSVTVPLLSSAITDIINADHRVMPLLPIGSVFVGIGIFYVFSVIRSNYIRVALGAFLCLYLLLQIRGFFVDRPADKDFDIRDYMAMQSIHFLQTQKSMNACLFLSPVNAEHLQLLQFREQYQYFLPSTKTHIEANAAISDTEAYIFKGSCPIHFDLTTKQQVTHCRHSNNYACPLGYFGDIVIHY